MKLLPSLLYPNFEEFSDRFTECLSASDEVHIDFADGVFVDNRLPDVSAVSSLDGTIQIEAHLMVQQPQPWVEEALEDQRFKRIIIQAESDGELGGLLQLIRSKGRKAGIALNPDTPTNVLLAWKDLLDTVLILMVDPGHNGSRFQPAMVDKIAEVSQIIPGVEVLVDGGIRPETLPLVYTAGADRAAIGSYLHGQPLKDGLENLKAVCSREIAWDKKES